MVVTITNTSGTVDQSLGGLRWMPGNLNAGSNSTMTVTLLVTNAGTLTNSVALSHYETDPVPANNLSTLTTLALPNPCLAPSAALAGWWPAEGNANDLLGTNNGVLVNGATFAPGKSGLAFSFNGSSAYVDLGRRSPGTQWSLEAWVNFSAIFSGRRAIIGTEADCRDWALVSNNGELGINIGKSGCAAIYGSGVIATPGTWYHMVGTCDGTNAAIYINGVLKNSGTVDLNYVGTSSGFRIGGAVCCGEYIAGLVDEPSFYNRALTAAEVFALYDAGTSGKCKAVLAPSLQLGAGNGPKLNLSWPAMATAFHLETTTAIGTPWQPWPGSPALVGDQLVFDIPPTNAMRLFRLKKP